MQSSTVRIDEESDEILRELVGHEKVPRTKIIHEALIDYRRKYFLKKCADAYCMFVSDSKASKKELEERELWDSTTSDGIEEDK